MAPALTHLQPDPACFRYMLKKTVVYVQPKVATCIDNDYAVLGCNFNHLHWDALFEVVQAEEHTSAEKNIVAVSSDARNGTVDADGRCGRASSSCCCAADVGGQEKRIKAMTRLNQCLVVTMTKPLQTLVPCVYTHEAACVACP